MENKRNNVLLTIIGVATLLVAIIGATFAYFSATGGTATQEVGTGTLKVSAVSGSVVGANIKPVDATAIASIDAKMAHADVAKLPISVNTTGTTISSEYNMFLTTAGVDLNPSELLTGGKLSDVKWELVKATTSGDATTYSTVKTGDFTNGDVAKLQINDAAVEIANGGTTDEYQLLIYINNTNDTVEGDGSGVQDKLQGLEITAYVTVEAKQK